VAENDRFRDCRLRSTGEEGYKKVGRYDQVKNEDVRDVIIDLHRWMDVFFKGGAFFSVVRNT
jgi:hypothetical protein